MNPISPEDATESAIGSPDRLGHVVQMTLAVYLLPVVAIVCAIGGAAILIEKAIALPRRLGFADPEGRDSSQLSMVRAGRLGTRPSSMLPRSRRIRAGR